MTGSEILLHEINSIGSDVAKRLSRGADFNTAGLEMIPSLISKEGMNSFILVVKTVVLGPAWN